MSALPGTSAPLSANQMEGLAAMPFNPARGLLAGPRPETLRQLEQRGLVYLDLHSEEWRRTVLGDAVWTNR